MTYGKMLQSNCHNTTIIGEGCGIDQFGRLKIRLADNSLKCINVGDISFNEFKSA